MHELSIAAELVRLCRAERERHAAGRIDEARIDEVRVAVGELASIEPDLLRHAWEAVVAGGPDAGARLEIDWRPARQTCACCGAVPERQPGSWLRLCPTCSIPLRLEGGDELDLLRISFQDVEVETEVNA